MNYYPPSLEKVIKEFSRFPGIGAKSAEKLAFHIMKSNRQDVDNLCQALLEVKQKILFCKVCFSLSEEEICSFCQDHKRDKTIIAVVEQCKDVISIEKTLEYKGLYHVLMGHLSPIKGIGPDELKIKELINRVKETQAHEVILATNPNVEGDATALYILDLLKPFAVKVSRIARGLPIGGDLEFADPLTLTKSLTRREEL